MSLFNALVKNYATSKLEARLDAIEQQIRKNHAAKMKLREESVKLRKEADAIVHTLRDRQI